MSHAVTRVNVMEMLVVGALAFGAGVVAAAWTRGRDAAAVEQALARLGDRLGSQSSLLVQRLEGIDDRMARSQVASTDLAQGIFAALGDVRRATAVVADQAKEFTALQDLLRAPPARTRWPPRTDGRVRRRRLGTFLAQESLLLLRRLPPEQKIFAHLARGLPRRPLRLRLRFGSPLPPRQPHRAARPGRAARPRPRRPVRVSRLVRLPADQRPALDARLHQEPPAPLRHRPRGL